MPRGRGSFLLYDFSSVFPDEVSFVLFLPFLLSLLSSFSPSVFASYAAGVHDISERESAPRIKPDTSQTALAIAGAAILPSSALSPIRLSRRTSLPNRNAASLSRRTLSAESRIDSDAGWRRVRHVVARRADNLDFRRRVDRDVRRILLFVATTNHPTIPFGILRYAETRGAIPIAGLCTWREYRTGSIRGFVEV